VRIEGPFGTRRRRSGTARGIASRASTFDLWINVSAYLRPYAAGNTSYPQSRHRRALYATHSGHRRQMLETILMKLRSFLFTGHRPRQHRRPREKPSQQAALAPNDSLTASENSENHKKKFPFFHSACFRAIRACSDQYPAFLSGPEAVRFRASASTNADAIRRLAHYART
jgi:hypothetical protein